MKTIKHFMLTLAVLLCSTSLLAHDFEVDGIYYQIMSSTDLTVKVSYKGNSSYVYSNEYSGSVTIPESVTYNDITYSVMSIGYTAFKDCTGLTSVTIGNSVTYIESMAFYGCTDLTSVVIPNSVKSIESNAFSDCSGLTSVTIGNGVTSIGNEAFYGCSGLTSVTIPNSVTSIGSSAFEYCYGLTSVTIPNSVESIGEDAFSTCSRLTSVHISDIAAWCKIDFGNNSSNPLCYAEHLFLDGEEIKDLVIPNSVTSIGDCAFLGCSGLTSVTIPNSVTSIGHKAFGVCSGLTSVIIPNSVTSIGNQTFYGCSGLNDVYCFASSAPETYSSTFGSNIGNATLHVPAGSVEAYAATEPWSGFGAIVALPVEEVELTIGTTGATTFCSEYALDFTDAEGVKAYAATGYNTETGVVTLTRVKTAKAGTGLFVVGDEGTYSIPTIESSADNSLNMLVGTTEEVTIPTADGTYTNYIYGKSDDTTGFFKLTGDKVIPAGKAYLRIPTEWFPAVAESKIKIEFEDGTTTGIEDVEEQVRPNDGVIYDLHGRVVKNPGKGIYIVNGKKVLF